MDQATLPIAQQRTPAAPILALTCKGCTWRRVIDGALQCTNQRTADPLTNTRCTSYEERPTA